MLGAYVHQDHIGTLLAHDVESTRGVCDSGSHRHIGLIGNGARKALTQDSLIFDDKDANHEFLLWAVISEESGMDTTSVNGGPGSTSSDPPKS